MTDAKSVRDSQNIAVQCRSAYIAFLDHCVYKYMNCLPMRWWIFLPVASALRYDWQCMHEANVDELKQIVQEYSESFPCEECRDHFNDLLEVHPFQLDDIKTDEDAKVWSWLTHNLVNKRLGKPWEPIDVMNQYDV